MRRVAVCLSLLILAACDGGMQEQAKIEPYEPPPAQWTSLVGALPPVPGTIHARDLDAGRPSDSAELAARGRERYAVFCSPCHGPGGLGDGGAVGRVVPQPPSLLDAARRKLPDRYLFKVISDGIGRMYGYAHRIPERDRWAIIAWLRERQRQVPTSPAPGTAADPQG